MKRRGNLNEREKHFVTAFIQEPNGAKAARLAGYSPKTAKVQASRLLTRPHVRAEIDKSRARVVERAEVDAAYVLCQAVEVHERCMQEVKPLAHSKGNAVKDGEGNVIYVFDAAGAIRSLEIIGKHKSVQAFPGARRVG